MTKSFALLACFCALFLAGVVAARLPDFDKYPDLIAHHQKDIPNGVIDSKLAATCTMMKKQFYPYSLVQQCFRNVKYSSSVAKTTIDVLSKASLSYVFKDIALNSPKSSLARIKVNIQAGLAAIGATNYTNDWDFQAALSSLYLYLKDPHTLYVKPSLYGAHSIQPFSLNVRFNSKTGQHIVFIEGILGLATQSPFYANFDLSSFVGATVNAIDRSKPIENILAHIKKNGYISKDYGALFNSALQSDYQVQPLRLFDFPKKPSRQFDVTLTNGTRLVVDMPWAIYFGEDKTYPPPANSASNPEEPLFSPSPQLEEFKLPKSLRKIFRGDHVNDNTPLLGADEDISVIAVTNKTITLKITTFSPWSDLPFLQVVDQLMYRARNNNIPYLILDMIGNGGGSICLGYEVINRLVSDRFPEGTYDMIHSPITDALAECAVKSGKLNAPLFGPNTWWNMKREPYQDISWYYPGRNLTRGATSKHPGATSTYSTRSYFGCSLKPATPIWNFTKIIVLSDGLCGSTCAVFTSHLDEVQKVDTISIGGIYSDPMQYFSFPGGLVLDYSRIAGLADQIGCRSDHRLPGSLPSDAGLRFAALEIYPWLKGKHHNTPLEFHFRPADFRLPIWLSSSPTEAQLLDLYKTVASTFLEK